MSTKREIVTMKVKLDELDSRISEAFQNGTEKDVLQLKEQIVKTIKRLSEIRSKFDLAVDNKEMFGADKFANVVRIRAKSENVGRPAKEKPVDTTLEF